MAAINRTFPSDLTNPQVLSEDSSPKIEDPTPSDDLFLAPLEDEGGGIGWWEVMGMALGSLFANKMRSLLTMLGVIIGVASVVALLALGGGAGDSITGQFESLGTNLLTVSPGSPSSRGPGSSGTAQTLTLDDAYAISALNLPVLGVAPKFNSIAQLVALAADTSSQVVGTTSNYKLVNNLNLASGVFFDDGHVSGTSPVIVLGATVATELFGSGQAIGQTVKVKGQTLRVIGVLKAEGGGTFGSVDDQAFVPISTAQKRLFGGRTPDGNGYLVSTIAVLVSNNDDMAIVEERIELLLREKHGLDLDGTQDDFDVMNQASFLDTLDTVISVFTLFLSAVAGISLLVGGIGIMNIMLVSVTERTREIGLRKALGARYEDILLQFVVEALLLSLMGGVIGLALGSSVALGVTLSGLLEAAVSPSSALLSLGFSLAVGLFFGIYPARQAAKLNPIQALRYQ
ncbi:MAG: ABC transporter permease [Ardenticatenaceae bacterium]